MSKPDKLKREFLAIILNDRDCGAKLARFQDWAACHEPKDVREAVRTDDDRVLIMTARIPEGSDTK